MAGLATVRFVVPSLPTDATTTGFHLSRPLPPSVFRAWVTERLGRATPLRLPSARRPAALIS